MRASFSPTIPSWRRRNFAATKLGAGAAPRIGGTEIRWPRELCSPAAAARPAGTSRSIWSSAGTRCQHRHQAARQSQGRTLITDITDSGQVFNALSSYIGLHEFDPSLRPQPVDAVVHFAAIPRIMITPDNEVFRVNAMGTYNVIEAAVKLGITKIVIASSETTYGLVFANEPRRPALSSARRRLRRRPDGQLRALQGRQREDGARLCVAQRLRHLCAAHRQRHRAA